MRVTLYIVCNTAACRDINWISVMEKMQFLSSLDFVKMQTLLEYHLFKLIF